MQRKSRPYKLKKDLSKHIIWFLVKYCLCHNTISTAQAQLPDIRFENIGIEQGLSSNFVVAITQDKFGYLWFGTNNGLNRYDGQDITTFWHEPEDSTSLAFDWVEALFVDHAGDLWVGTHGGGLHLFDYTTESFIRYQHDPKDPLSLSNDVITTLYEDSDQNFWVGTAQGGLNKFDRINGTFKKYRHQEWNPGSLSDDNVRQIYEDRQGNLWVGTGGPFPTELGGLNLFDKQHETFVRFLPDPTNPQSLTDNRVWEMYEDNHGTFWVGTFGDGLHIMDREKGTFTRLQNNAKNLQPYSSPYLRRKDPTNPGFGPGITKIYQEHTEVLWISSVYGGLDRFDLNTGTRQHFEADKNEPANIGLNWIWTIYEDRQNTLWLASAGNGVYKVSAGAFHHSQHPTKELSFQAIFEDSRGQIWLGTDKGLFHLDKKTYAIIPFEKPNMSFSELARESVQAITEDQTGKVWFGTSNGLYRLDPPRGNIKKYTHHPEDPNSLSQNNITALANFSSKKNGIWALSQDNILHRYDPEADQFYQYNFFDSLTTDWQNNHSILSLYADPEGYFWMGMDAGGAIKWDPKTKAIQYFPDIFPWALYFHFDKKERFWIGSRLEGLLQFDPTENVVLQKITEKEGLVSGRINGILEDKSGFLWLSTQDGFLSRFDPETGNIKNFHSKDGLKRNNFLPGSFCRSRNGHFIFGGLNGITIFDPEAFLTNPFHPEVTIGEVLVNDQPILVREKATIELSHHQNDLTFRFAALHYTRPDKNQVLTMLEGYDDNWQTMGQRKEAKYTNLDPGVYSFKVKAANSDGIWTPNETMLQTIIHPPWWQTWWAYALYLIATFCVFYSFFQFQKRRWMLQAALQLEQAESLRLKELDEFKSRFYTNITHEFRTPLTIIRGLVDQIVEKPKWKTTERLQLIKKNSTRLLQLINQLLELSKLQAGKLKPQFIQADIIPFLDYLVESFHSLAFSKKISLSFHAHTDKLVMDYDPDKCQQIMVNLLSNAIKFTPEYGSVKVSTKLIAADREKLFLQVTIEDTGIGIPQEKIPLLFERFYQVDGSITRKEEGIGLGLALVRELLELLGGNVEVESTPDSGSKFIFFLPVNNSAPLQAPEILEKNSLPEDVPSASTAIPSTFPQTSSNARPLVLLVEDNQDVIYYLRSCLDDIYQILEAKNGEEGVNLAIESIPDLVISDVMMPKMDGFELCKRLKTDKRTNHIPIVLLTAKATEEDKLEGLELGADAYLAKPFQKKELLIRISKLLELRKTLQRKFQKTNWDKNEKPDPFLEKLQEVIENHLDDADFSVVQLSRKLGMSRVQIHRKLKALTDLSTTQYIRAYRLNKAHQLLKNTELSVSEVGYKIGFKDPAHFSRVFAKHFGTAPSVTRK